MKKIKVLIVDDSAIARALLEKGLSQDPMINVIAKASNAYAAKDKILLKHPDVVTLDVEMPGKNGLDFLKELMLEHPLPVVMVSAFTESGSRTTIEALNAGAVDFVLKASTKTGVSAEKMINKLIEKIKIAANVDLSKFQKKKEEYDKKSIIIKRSKDLEKKTSRIIAIGASTGGVQTITKIIRDFTPDMPGTLIVQHMPKVFTKMFADRLNQTCKVHVKEAEDNEIITNGTVYIAEGGKHLKIRNNKGILELISKDGENVNGHCPSVDVLFNSIAEQIGKNSIGLLLTGMGRDGAFGLLNMKESGARTFAQDEESSIIFGMPYEAYKCGAVEKLLNLDIITSKIKSILNEMDKT